MANKSKYPTIEDMVRAIYDRLPMVDAYFNEPVTVMPCPNCGALPVARQAAKNPMCVIAKCSSDETHMTVCIDLTAPPGRPPFRWEDVWNRWVADALAERTQEPKRLSMSDLEFRAILDLWMCCDPWPVHQRLCDHVVDPGAPCENPPTCDEENHSTLEGWLNRECKARGFDGWVDAYHEFKPDEHNKDCRCPTGTSGCPTNKDAP